MRLLSGRTQAVDKVKHKLAAELRHAVTPEMEVMATHAYRLTKIRSATAGEGARCCGLNVEVIGSGSAGRSAVRSIAWLGVSSCTMSTCPIGDLSCVSNPSL